MSEPRPDATAPKDGTGAPPRSRIKRLVIEELFGPGSGTIDIKFNLDDRVTILHGRNGSGKTITLGLIEAIAKGRMWDLIRLPFRRFLIETNMGESLSISSSATDMHYRVQAEGVYESQLHRPTRCTLAEILGWTGLTEAQLRETIADRVHWVKHVEHDKWQDGRDAELVDTATVFGRNEALFMSGPFAQIFHQGPHDFDRIESFRQRMPAVRTVWTDRLRQRIAAGSRSEVSMVEAGGAARVDLVSVEIRSLVQAARLAFRDISSSQSGTLAKRVVSRLDAAALAPEELQRRYDDLEARERHLFEMGLLEEVEDRFEVGGLDGSIRLFLETHLEDRWERLEPFKLLDEKITFALERLSSKLAPKRLKLSAENGYEVVANSGTVLPLTQLSSGEQHNLVMMHELLFGTEAGTLILIDEPELSLHVDWQTQVLGDLLEIAKLSQLDVLVATHSPYIVGDRTDLLVRVGEPNP